MPFAAEWISDVPGFAALEDEWEAMLPPEATPFDTHAWHSAWIGAFGAELDLAVRVVRRDGLLVGAFPLMREEGRLIQLGNVHSPIMRPIAADDEALHAAIGAALEDRSVELEAFVPAGDAAVAALAAAAREAGMHPLALDGPATSFVDTSGDLEAWRKSGHKSDRARLARYRRKMDREHDASFEAVVSPPDLEAWIADGFAVEASGWKGAEGTAILSATDTTAFYTDVARRFHARDQLRLARIVLDGSTVAFSFTIQMNGTVWGMKSGYDENWRKLSAGLVLQLTIIERCFELAGVEAYELLGYASDWKDKFGTGTRAWTTVRIYPKGPVGAGRHLYRSRLRPVLRTVYRRVRRRGA